jgi:drug/metabolite transporter superfamily protein YnfA
MSKESRILAGVMLITYPSVIFGGVSLLSLLVFTEDYAANPLRQDLWRAGHAHAGVYLLLSLVILWYVDEANLSDGWKWAVRLAAPIAAILVPLAFFVSMLDPKAQEPNGVIYLAYVGALVLAVGLFVLGVGLVRGSSDEFSSQSPSVFWRSP